MLFWNIHCPYTLNLLRYVLFQWLKISKHKALSSRYNTIECYTECHGLLTRYVKLHVVHAPGMSWTFSPPPTSKALASWRSRHASWHVRHAHAVMHVLIASPRWRGKRCRHSRRMRNPQFYVSVKRPMPSRCIAEHRPSFKIIKKPYIFQTG